MDTKQIEKFSVEAREQLLKDVEQRLYTYGLDDAGRGEFGPDSDVVRGTVLTAGEKSQRSELYRRVEDEGVDAFVEEMAYTWFNRFAALRYMELHDFLSNHVRVLSAADGSFEPECLRAAATLELPGLDRSEVARLIQAGDDEALYRVILVAQMNELANALPTVFGAVAADALTLPANLLRKSEFNVLCRLVTAIPEDAWQNVEILGWMYQFYNSERKREFFDSKRKATEADLAPATQLFTPEWIVRYMVDNSLGRLWMLNHPESRLRDHAHADDPNERLMEYYIEPDEEHEDFIHVSDPEEITFCDPACGSGHILVYAFRMLMAIYEECGYREREIPELILTKNLSGLEIDPRAAQIATLALALCAREHDRRFFGRGVTADITVLQDVHINADELPAESPLREKDELLEDLAHLGEIGSLLQPTESDISALEASLSDADSGSLFASRTNDEVRGALVACRALARRFDVVVANPPYMGSSSFNPFMSKRVKKHYTDSCKDLCTAFIERGYVLTSEQGYSAMVTMQSWMFLGSFEKMRNRIIDEKTILTMAHLGTRAFDAIGGEVVSVTADVLYNGKSASKGAYVRLVDIVGSEPKREKLLEAIQNPDCGWFYRADAATFHDIPGSPIAYWAGAGLLNAFRMGEAIDNYSSYTGSQNKTGDNATYLRLSWEINYGDYGRGKKWCAYSKGGDFRRWYGNTQWVIDWSDGARSFYRTNPTSNLLNERYWFQEGVSYTMLTSGKANFRYQKPDGVFDMAGPEICALGSNLSYFLALLNTNIVQECLDLMNPTLNLQAKDVKALPVLFPDDSEKKQIECLAVDCIKLSKLDWNSLETSSNFRRNPLVESYQEGASMLVVTVNSSPIDGRWEHDEAKPEEAVATVEVSFVLNREDVSDDRRLITVSLRSNLITTNGAIWQQKIEQIVPLIFNDTDEQYEKCISISFVADTKEFCFANGDRIDLQVQRGGSSDPWRGGWSFSFEFKDGDWSKKEGREFKTESKFIGYIKSKQVAE